MARFYRLLSDYRTLLAIMTGLYTLGALVLSVTTRYDGDEGGLYLNSARLVLQGQMPYRDFMFHQFPLFPYLYAPVALTPSPALSARLLTALFSIALFVCTVFVAKRLGGIKPAVVAALLMLVYWEPATYLARHTAGNALVDLLLMSGLLLIGRRRLGSGGYWLPAAAIALAAGIRGNVLVLLPAYLGLTGVIVLARRARAKNFYLSLIAGLGLILLVFIPFLITVPEQIFRDIGANLVRPSFWNQFEVPYLSLAALKNRLIYAALLAYDYGLVLLAGALSIPLAWSGLRSAKRKLEWLDGNEPIVYGIILWLGLLAFNVFLMPGGPGRIYLVTAWPLTVVLGAWTVCELWERTRADCTLAWKLTAAGLVGLVLLWQPFRVVPHVNLRSPAVFEVQDAAAVLAARTPPNALVAAHSDVLQVVVEAGRNTPRGLEMGYHFYAPRWPSEEARKYGWYNDEMLLEDLSGRVDVFLVRDRIDPLLAMLEANKKAAALFAENYEVGWESPGFTGGPGIKAYVRR